MTLYEHARKHAWFMAGALVLSILFVLVIDRYFGHSVIAFGIAIIGLVLANRRMLSFNCPTCGKNVFFRGSLALPWPQKICSKCGTELDQPAQNR